MGGESDGSIILNTELDATGFEKGSDKLLSAVNDLTGAVDNLGDNMMQSFQQVIPLLKQMADSFGSAAQAANSAVQATGQTGKAAANAVDGAGKSATQSMGALEKQTLGLTAQLESLKTKAMVGFSNEGQVIKFQRALEAIGVKLETTKKQVEDFGKTRFESDPYRKATEQLAAYEAKMREIETEKMDVRQRANELLAINPKSPELTDLVDRMAELKKEASELDKYMSGLAKTVDQMFTSGRGTWHGADTEEYARMMQNLEQAQDVMRSLQAQSAGGQASLPEASTIPTPPDASIDKWQIFISLLQKAGSAILSFVKTSAKLSLAAISKGVDLLKSKLQKFTSQAKQADQFAKKLTKSLTSVKRMLITRVKRMFIGKIFNAIKEDLQALAKYSSSFDAAMSNIKNAATGLGANLAVTFGGLIQTIEPILTRIINAISTAITYINAFFGLLGGKSVITVAKKQTGSYVAGLDNAATSAGNAADKQEELNEAIYGFDELNKRSDTNDSGSGSGSGGGNGGTGSTNPSDLFTTMPIDSILPDSLKELAEKIKAAIAAGDWEGVGRAVAEGLNTIVDAIDKWNKETFRPKAVKFAENFARTLNGFFEGWDAMATGNMLGGLFNTVLETAYKWITTFNWGQMGRKIGDLFNGLVDGVNWDLLGHTIGGAIAGFWSAVRAWANSTDWAAFGSKVATGLNSLIDEHPLQTKVKAIAEVLNGFSTFLSTFNSKVNWNAIREELTQSVTSALNINVEGIISNGGNIVSRFVEALSKSVTDNREGFVSFGERVGSAIGNLRWDEIIGNAGSAVVVGFSGLLEGVAKSDIYHGITLVGEGVGATLGTAIRELPKVLDSSIRIAGGAIGGVLEGIFSGWSVMVATIFNDQDWLNAHAAMRGAQQLKSEVEQLHGRVKILAETHIGDIFQVETQAETLEYYRAKLDELVDGQGHIKEGYEAEVEAIYAIFGVDADVRDGQVQNIGEVNKAINDVIENYKKEAYTQVELAQTTSWIEARRTATNDLNKAIESYQENIKLAAEAEPGSDNYFKYTQAAATAVEAAMEAAGIISESDANIALSDENMAAISKGAWDDVKASCEEAGITIPGVLDNTLGGSISDFVTSLQEDLVNGGGGAFGDFQSIIEGALQQCGLTVDWETGQIVQTVDDSMAEIAETPTQHAQTWQDNLAAAFPDHTINQKMAELESDMAAHGYAIPKTIGDNILANQIEVDKAYEALAAWQTHGYDLSSLETYQQEILSEILGITQDTGQDIADAMSDSVDDMGEAVNKVSQHIDTEAGKAKVSSQNLRSNINGELRGLGSDMGGEVEGGVGKMQVALRNGQTSIQTDAQDIKDKITGAISPVEDDMTTTGDKAGGNLDSSFGRYKSIVSDTVKTIYNLFSDNLGTNLPPMMSQWGNSAGQGYNDGLTQWVSGITATVYNLTQNIVNSFSNLSNNLQIAGQNAGSSLSSGLSSGLAYVYDHMVVVGQNAMIGFNNGMVDREQLVYNTAQTIANNAVGVINSSLQIGSPSRVLFRTGQNTDKGFALGIEDGERDVLRAVSSMASNVIDAADTSEAELGLDMSADYAASELDNVAQKLSTIAMIFLNLRDTFAVISEIPLPDILSGSAVPVRTAVSSITSSAAGSNGVGSMAAAMEAQNALLRQQNELLQELIDASGGEIPVSSILNGVNRANRRAGKAVL